MNHLNSVRHAPELAHHRGALGVGGAGQSLVRGRLLILALAIALTLPVTAGDTHAASRPTGDCNADGTVDAADLSALVAGLFGDRHADPAGCDANQDTRVDAADLTCTVRLMFDGPSACHIGGAVPAVSDLPPVPDATLGDCPAAAHDGFAVTGPDGRRYRTWHPVEVPRDPNQPDGPRCTLAHEHGDPPHPDAPRPAFGYLRHQAGGPAGTLDHGGYKTLVHRAGGQTGWQTPELNAVTPDWDLQLWLHQGTADRTRLTTRHHPLAMWARDAQGAITEVYVMADTGPALTRCQDTPPPDGPYRLLGCLEDRAFERWAYHATVDGALEIALTLDVIDAMTFVDGVLPCAAHDCAEVDVVPSGAASCPSCPAEATASLGAPDSPWLGRMRVLASAEWRWTNAGNEAYRCTDADGAPADAAGCAAGARGHLWQLVAARDITTGHTADGAWDRTDLALPFDVLALPLGAPGGN